MKRKLTNSWRKAHLAGGSGVHRADEPFLWRLLSKVVDLQLDVVAVLIGKVANCHSEVPALPVALVEGEDVQEVGVHKVAAFASHDP